MVVDVQQSLVRVTSAQSDNRDFGTGFVIHQDGMKTYVVTCAHVVRDIGGLETVIIAGKPGKVVAMGETDGFDLAVVAVEGMLNRTPLTIQPAGFTGAPIILTGFSAHGQARVLRQIRGKLKKPFHIEGIEQTTRADAWDFEITDEDNLEKGYSGSPVLSESTGHVLGMVITRRSEKQGTAISINALSPIWAAMPVDLILPYKADDRMRSLLPMQEPGIEFKAIDTKRDLKQELLETLALAFSHRRTIDPLIGEALHIRFEPSLYDAATIFEAVINYCEINSKRYLASLLNRAIQYQPHHQHLKTLRALLVDNGSIPSIDETSIFDNVHSVRIDETIPGGRYIVNGEYKDADGNSVDPPERYEMITNVPLDTELTPKTIHVVLHTRKRQRGFKWDMLRDAFQSTYGGNTSITQRLTSELAFNWTAMDKAMVLRDAEDGKIDLMVQANGGIAVLEIFEDNECLFNYVPSLPEAGKRSLKNVTADKLLEAFNEVDVLLLTTTRVEWDALRAQMLPWPGENSILEGFISTRTYHLGQMGNYRVAHVASTMGGGGRQGAFITGLQALEETKPKAFILVGIAFGVDRQKQRLGDVLIAESVFPYDLQRVGDKSSIHRGAELPCGITLSNRFQNLREDWELIRGPRRVNTFQGLILSGDKLIDNQEFRDSLLNNFPTALGGEMEGWGAYAASGEKGTEMILVKAICDWADGHKHDRAQTFAAYSAVSLVKYVLSKRDVLNNTGAREVDETLEGQILLDDHGSLSSRGSEKTINIKSEHGSFEDGAALTPYLPPHLPGELTRLVGRSADISAIVLTLQGDVRLLTLTGAPGIGKTRLGKAVAENISSKFSDGMYFVPLASISNAALVVSEIAKVADVNEIAGTPLLESLKAALFEKDVLLLLDNFEHVMPAGKVVEDLLKNTLHLKVLITSRRRLGVPGEREITVKALAVPDLMLPLDVEALMQNYAVELFVDRVRDIVPTFILTRNNILSVATICKNLDGLPLAIELIASWLKVYTNPQDLLAKMSPKLPLLVREDTESTHHQRTMRTAIAWSYDLLTPAEKKLFRWLAVFAGGWSLDAVESICLPLNYQLPNVLNSLRRLIEHSLVVQVGSEDEPRFTLLETIREYALELLSRDKNKHIIRHAHAMYFVSLAEQGEPELSGKQQEIWLQRLETEHDNERSALNWALGPVSETELALRGVGALALFWYSSAYWSEGRRWLEQALKRSSEVKIVSPASASIRAKALNAAAILAGSQADYKQSLVYHTQSLELNREWGDKRGMLKSIGNIGVLLFQRDKFAEAASHYETYIDEIQLMGEPSVIAASLTNWGISLSRLKRYDEARERLLKSEEMWRAQGNLNNLVHVLQNLGNIEYDKSDRNKAVQYFDEALSLQPQRRDKYVTAAIFIGLGRVAIDKKNYNGAHQHFQQSIKLLIEIGDEKSALSCLENFASLFMETKNLTRAVRTYSIVQALRQRIDSPLDPPDRLHFDQNIAAVRNQLGDTDFTREWSKGQLMTLTDAIDYVLADED